MRNVTGTLFVADQGGNLYDADLTGSFERALLAEHGNVIQRLTTQHDDDGLSFALETSLDSRAALATFGEFRMDSEDDRGWWEILVEDVEVD